MKKFLILFFLMTFSLGYSQGLSQGFESGGINGAPFASGPAPTVTREAGPGTNTTQVVKFVGNTGSALWQGVNLSLTTNVNLTAATTRTMSIDVYASGPLFFLVKVNGGLSGAPEAAAVVEYTGTNTWQTCSFTFNSVRDGKAAAANGTYTSFVLHAYWPSAAATTFPPGNATARTLYVDNISGPLALPTATVGTFTVPSKIVGDATFTITPPTSNNTSAFTYTSSNTAVGTIVNGNQIQVGSSGSATITASQVSDGTYSATSSTATFTVTPSPPPSAPTPPARNAWDVVSLYSGAYTPTAGAVWQNGVDVSLSGNNARYFDGFTLARLAFAARSVSAMTTLHIDVYTLNQNQLWFEINGNRKVVSSIPLNGWASFDIPLTDYVGLNLGNVSFFDLNNPTGAAAPVKQVYLDNIYFYRAATDAPPTIGALTVTGPRVVGDAPFTLTDPTSNSSGAWSYSASPTGILTFSGNTATIVGAGTATITATQAAVPGVYGAGTASASLVVNYAAPGPSPIPPVRDAGCVVSMYTGTPTTYANVVATSQASWSTGSTNSNFSFANGTDTCIQVNNLGFFGLVTSGANFSVSTMSKLHVDIYVNTPMTTMILNLLAPSDRNYSIGPLVAGWNSFDIPLSVYGTGFTNINGIKFEQSGGTARQIYIDNVYFYTGGTPTISNFANIGKVNGDAPFSLTAPTSDSPGAFTYTSSNEAVATISGSTVTVVGQGTSTITANQVASGCFAAGSITATLTVAASTIPLTGPPVPPARNAWDVVSVFSGAYTPVAGTRNYNPNWGQTGQVNFAQPVLAGDQVIKYKGVNYQGIDIGSTINTTTAGMTHVHIDIWTATAACSTTDFRIIDGADRSKLLSTPLGQWNSFDIPLTDFVGLNQANIYQFKFQRSPYNQATDSNEWYIDNIYFYRPATTQPPTLGAFTVPAKVIGDAAFTLTPPTSNSAGAFTYTSSNTAVATITGSTVTVVGAGSSTITATQAADGSYGSGTITATLSVTPPAAPTPPARNAWDVVSFYSDTYTNSSPPNWNGGSDISISGNTTRLLSNYTLGTLNFASANVSAMTTLHLDIFSVNQNPTWIRINGQQQFVATTPVNGWTSLDIPLSSFTGANLSAVTSIVIFNPTGAEVPLKTAYVDNVYFFKESTTYTTSWSNSAPTASVDAIIDGDLPTTTDLVCKDLTINSGKTLTIGAGNKLTVSGNLINNGTIVFKSDVNGTAMFDVFNGAQSGTGVVTTERYIPLGKRAFRLLSPAVTTTTFISGNWQQQTHITGGASGGFDVSETNNPSMFTYNNQVASGTGWTPIANTNATNLIAGVGYRMLVRGDRTPTNITAATTDNMNAAITLSATGTLKTGTVTLNASSTPAINNTANTTTADYSLVGNPYQSAVDWHAVTKSGIEDTYYAWAPNMGTGAARGNYVAYNVSTGNSGGGQVGQFIQPGQAFFVKNTTPATAGTLTFQEAHKATTSANVFRTANQTESANPASLSMQLYDPNELAIGGYPIDATKAVFSSDYSNELGLGDAAKLEAAGENIAWFRNNTKLAIDAAAPVTTSDELVMKTLRLGANKNYTFKIQTTNFDTDLTPYLVDNFLNTQTEIATSQAFLASFATTSNQASYSEDRFKIVFQNSALSTDDFANNIKLYPNPAKAGASFYVDGITEATVSVYNVVGQNIPVTVMSQGNAIQVTPSASLSNGVYLVSITTQGITKQVKWIVE